MRTWCLGHYFFGTALFPFGRPGPLFGATSGAVSTDAVLVGYESFDLSKTHSLSTQDLVKIFID
jgi:hypothetical protein